MIGALPSQGMMRISELMPIKYHNYSMESSDGAMRTGHLALIYLELENSRRSGSLNFFFLFVPTTLPMQSSISEQRLTSPSEI